jgi:hypothetical protein
MVGPPRRSRERVQIGTGHSTGRKPQVLPHTTLNTHPRPLTPRCGPTRRGPTPLPHTWPRVVQEPGAMQNLARRHARPGYPKNSPAHVWRRRYVLRPRLAPVWETGWVGVAASFERLLVRCHRRARVDASAWKRAESGRPSASAHPVGRGAGGGSSMLILGLVLLIIGWLTNLGILVTLGIILLVIGAVLWIMGSMGRPVGGRRHYW